ncbi:hypothetical protein LTR60_002038 [Cryomyces antarcticus]|nr:hypothetical protein LTR60_002038 [Cryomyces antarcticus]
MTPTSSAENTSGALVFIAYIFAALFLTTYILRTLFVLHSQTSSSSSLSPQRETPVKGWRIQLHASLAALSFAALSYNMLRFLILSYAAWAAERNLPVSSPFSLLGGLVPSKSTRGSARTGLGDLQLWQWSKTSTLFTDFARELCASPRAWWWSLQALVGSWVWGVWMSAEGQTRHIPSLWAFFALAQILPVSFTMNLFFLALLLTPRPTAMRSAKQPKPSSAGPSTPTVPLALSLAAYFAALALAPVVAGYGNDAFMPLVLFLRVLLLSPFLLIRSNTTIATATTSTTTSQSHSVYAYRTIYVALAVGWVTLGAWQSAVVGRAEEGVGGGGSKRHPNVLRDSAAVGALGWDFLIGVVSWSVWSMWGW